MKTNVMRILDKAKIKYELVTYQIEMKDFNAQAVSDLIEMDYGSCYKTLGLTHEHEVYICVVPANKQIDLKKCAKALNVKNLEMIHVKDLLKKVGYERGSVSPIGLKKNNGIVFDSEVLNHEEIEISAGQFGMGLKVNREEIVNFVHASIKDICIE